MNSPSDGDLELCAPREWSCGVPPQAGVQLPLRCYKALAGGPWTSVHHSEHGVRFPRVPEEMTSATYIPLPSGCPLPWPSWLSGGYDVTFCTFCENA